MTSFGKRNTSEHKRGDGQSWLAEVKDELQEVFAEAVADYDGEDVEDFAMNCHEASWEVVEKRLKESFVNGRRASGRKRKTDD